MSAPSMLSLKNRHQLTYKQTVVTKIFRSPVIFWSPLFLGASEVYQIEQRKLEAPTINGLGSK